jgi:rare lipoprotein A
MKGKGLTAAHASLPMKTKISVTNLQNKKQVVVTISAHMVPSGNRILDVSQEAALALGMGDKGITAVVIEVVR